ncbi:thiamine phosphate synthase [Marinomonas sp. M1K-6]|uniref:Thiamine-phosphate synthase n=1 Tax=Marinomonas profundi TaxID=2726122 RepID=A0A847QVI6_9GAMM|nr:thiamine phosphate synthase [Marinomonas profundi]NLQ16978.1 thiamine phosphate synthase [Marinomonas profundi]UDV02703.1 thiamine phosphate synthase [Marinomonas profundi]
MSIKPPVVWCVGGSDSSAHAGLQADLRTGQDLRCHVQTIVTCITAQNSQEVRSVEPVSLAMFNAQWQTLLDDVPPDAIKVSLLPSIEIVKACSTWLQRIKADFPNVLVVFDPVMAASSESGNRLQQDSVGAALLECLLPYVDVITPNLLEFEALTGLSGQQPIVDVQGQLAAYLSSSRCAWLLKGGHSDAKQATDWLVDHDAIVGFSNEKLTVHNTRGTGCTLSTALASFIAHGYDLLDAMTMAKAYITGALKTGVQIGVGAGPLGRPGWPLQIENLPTIVSPSKTPINIKASTTLPFASMNREKMGLYPVVDSIAWLELVLKQGVKIAQLRIKDPDDVDLESNIQQAITLGKEYDAHVFINDYWQQAIALGAYGVHLGQEDLDVADLAQIQAAGLRLGISTHGYYEIARAQSIQPSYIALGHIFPTQTKDMPSQPQGLTRLAHYAALLKDVFPTVAIGGISAERLPAVTQTGVNGVAVVTAITKAAEPALATRSLMMAFEESVRGER